MIKRKITSRFVLYVGFKCNLRCQFCYYLKSIEDGSAKNSDYETLAKKIRQARKLGKDQIDFTGGEATIHPDFIKLVELCKELGFNTINVITNGLRFADINYFEKAKQAGLNEVLLSIHSNIKEVHDELTKVPGSFDKIIEAAKNAKRLNVRLRINACINNKNYLYVDEYLNFLSTLQPTSVNLIVFNPTEETPGYTKHDAIRIASYSDIALEIEKALIKHEKNIPIINIRFLPFCFLKGREEYIRTYWQEIYEQQEWDPILHWAYRKGWWFPIGSILLGSLLSIVRPLHIFHGVKSFYTYLAEFFQNLRVFYLFKHTKDCKICSFKNVCPGLHRDFLKKQVDEPKLNFYPIENGILENDPVRFGRNKYPEKFPN